MICGTFRVFFWTPTFKSNVEKWLFDTKDLFFPIDLIIIDCCESIIFSEMKVGALKSERLREDSGHSICCFLLFFHHLNIFHNHFDHYFFMLINYFLRNGARNTQKRTFVRRQWTQYLLILFFIQHLSQSI